MSSEKFACKVSEKHIEKQSLNSPNSEWSFEKLLTMNKNYVHG